jgi:hypothetical protein
VTNEGDTEQGDGKSLPDGAARNPAVERVDVGVGADLRDDGEE